MKIAFHKIDAERHALVIERGGRTERVECETRSYLVHDLLHYAVESEAGLDGGFWGHLARGKTLADMNDRTGKALAGQAPELLDLPTGVPLGVGGVAFSTTEVDLEPGDRLVLYTDGLVETRRDPLDARLDRLLSLLDTPARSLDEVCELLLRTLHEPDNFDDVALLIARVRATGD